MADKKNKLYRKQALEQLSSPENLNQSLQISNSLGWVAVATLGVILAAALVWGIWGSVATQVTTQGIILHQSGIENIQTQASGKLINVSVSVGDSVTDGTVIATMRLENLEQRIEDAKETLQNLKKEHRLYVSNASEKLQLNEQTKLEQEEKLHESLTAQEEQIAFLEEKLDDMLPLYEDQLITQQKLVDVQEQVSQARIERTDILNQISTLENNFLEQKNSFALDTLQNYDNVLAQQRTVKDLTRQKDRQSKIRSDFNGTIVEILAFEDELVTADAAIARVSPQTSDYPVILFASPYDGKKIEPGMEAQISPSTVSRDEYGSMVATVTSVSEVPASPQRLNNLLENESLVNTVSQSGPPIIAIVELEYDEDTGNFVWTSSKQPPYQIGIGTLCTATVTVMTQPPISLVIPILEEAAGL